MAFCMLQEDIYSKTSPTPVESGIFSWRNDSRWKERTSTTSSGNNCRVISILIGACRKTISLAPSPYALSDGAFFAFFPVSPNCTGKSCAGTFCSGKVCAVKVFVASGLNDCNQPLSLPRVRDDLFTQIRCGVQCENPRGPFMAGFR